MTPGAEIVSVLAQRSGFEALSVEEGLEQLRIAGRVRAEGNNTGNWSLIINQLLIASENNAPWKVDISRHYFRQNTNQGRRMFYCWRLIFRVSANDLPAAVSIIIGAIRSAPVARAKEVEEMPLTGASRFRNEVRNGKGAGASGTLPVGPLAIRRG
jgi:hypothetical protein